MTPILPPEPGHVPRNHLGPDGALLYYNHMPASEIRDRLGVAQFKSMFRFCVEREPVEKCISHFHMLRNSPQHNPDGTYRKSWSDYVADGRFPRDHQRYSEIQDGRRVSLVSRILRYDRLEQELSEVLADLGLPDFALKTRAKSEYSKNRLVTPEQVTPEERQKIYKTFGPTLAISGIDWTA